MVSPHCGSSQPYSETGVGRWALPVRSWQERAGFEGRGGALRAPERSALSSSPFPETLPARGPGQSPGQRGARDDASPAPLDKMANSVSPETAVERRRDRRNHRYRLRKAAAVIVQTHRPKARVCRCGRYATGSNVNLHLADGNASTSGVVTCGSVWDCAVCAAKITEQRREEIDRVLGAHREAGGCAFMATLTVRHHRNQSCRFLRRVVAAAWRRVKSGKAWMAIKEHSGWMGDIRALEVTHSDNAGWHPHLHALVFFKPGTPETEIKNFAGWLYDAWARAASAAGLGECVPEAFTWSPVSDDNGAAQYVGKWGAALELTKSHTKRGRGGRTPWQLLADYAQLGRERDADLFREYSAAFYGARQLTWSRGLRDLYPLPPEKTDEELAAEPDAAPETVVALIDKPLFELLADVNAVSDLQVALEAGGILGVQSYLSRLRIPWRIATAPGFQRGTYVPLFSWDTHAGFPSSLKQKDSTHEHPSA